MVGVAQEHSRDDGAAPHWWAGRMQDDEGAHNDDRHSSVSLVHAATAIRAATGLLQRRARLPFFVHDVAGAPVVLMPLTHRQHMTHSALPQLHEAAKQGAILRILVVWLVQTPDDFRFALEPALSHRARGRATTNGRDFVPQKVRQ